MLDTNHWPDEAGRNAYMASFHAAKALIFERTGKALRRHEGVQREFHHLAHIDPSIDKNLPIFLSQAYTFKQVADYETGTDAIVAPERARIAVGKARQFVQKIAGLL